MTGLSRTQDEPWMFAGTKSPKLATNATTCTSSVVLAIVTWQLLPDPQAASRVPVGALPSTPSLKA